MTEDDLDRVMDLENQIFASPWRRSFFRADIDRPAGMCIVAEDDEVGVVGYAVAWGTDEVHLANLAVVPEARRKGVGKQLLAAVIGYAGRAGAKSIYLEVRLSNTIARKFYAGYAFVPTYLRKGYYENGEDAVIMEKELEAGG
jgi:ribosomal-protein-alanine N-acetyltransferase